ncbi:MAG: hypothetical protein WA989_08215 [Henriciella sp.]|uniref:hypothetical protein n=1 Tax=Henriciella sp. TaxID=1968823 RepID=UPI003C751025
MTLVFERKLDGVGPRMHAMVLGVGRFSHVKPDRNPERKACPDSARAMVEFLMAYQDRFLAPLASIECLLSDPRNDAGKDTLAHLGAHDPRPDDSVDPGTIAGVRKASNAWLDRGQEGDVYFFYGCSHGVAGRDGGGLFVCEDWGASHNRGEGLLDVRSIADEMPSGMKASGAWVFLDACQEVITELAEMVGGVDAYRPKSVGYRKLGSIRSVSLAATPYAGTAFAPDEGVAYFTDVLLQGLKDSFVEPENSLWYVTGRQVMTTLDRLFLALHGRVIEPTTIGLPGFGHRLMPVDTPRVAVAVDTVPQKLILDALRVEVCPDRQDEGPVVTRADDELTWRFFLPLDERRLVVRMQHPPSEHRSQPFHLEPPATIVKVPK